MQKYKIQFTQTQDYVLDVMAETEEEAKVIAQSHFETLTNDAMLHYYEESDLETTIANVYDVTNTDDPFNPLN